MSDSADLLAAANRKARGKRPYFLESRQTEQVLSVVMAVAQELAVLRERQDTLERLLEQHGLPGTTAIEGFVPDDAALEARGRWTEAYLARILRILHQDAESLQVPAEHSAEDVARELAGD
jgi:hypothetical protein